MRSSLTLEAQKYLDVLERIRIKYREAEFEYIDCICNDIIEQVTAKQYAIAKITRDSQILEKPLAFFVHYAIYQSAAKLLTKADCRNSDGTLTEKGIGFAGICLRSAGIFSTRTNNQSLFTSAKKMAGIEQETSPRHQLFGNISQEEFSCLIEENWLLDREETTLSREERERVKIDIQKILDAEKEERNPERIPYWWDTEEPPELSDVAIGYVRRIKKCKDYALFLKNASRGITGASDIVTLQSIAAEFFNLDEWLIAGRGFRMGAAFSYLDSIGVSISMYSSFAMFYLVQVASGMVLDEITDKPKPDAVLDIRELLEKAAFLLNCDVHESIDRLFP